MLVAFDCLDFGGGRESGSWTSCLGSEPAPRKWERGEGQALVELNVALLSSWHRQTCDGSRRPLGLLILSIYITSSSSSSFQSNTSTSHR